MPDNLEEKKQTTIVTVGTQTNDRPLDRLLIFELFILNLQCEITLDSFIYITFSSKNSSLSFCIRAYIHIVLTCLVLKTDIVKRKEKKEKKERTSRIYRCWFIQSSTAQFIFNENSAKQT